MQILHTILGYCSCNEADFSLGNINTVKLLKFSISIQLLKRGLILSDKINISKAHKKNKKINKNIRKFITNKLNFVETYKPSKQRIT